MKTKVYKPRLANVKKMSLEHPDRCHYWEYEIKLMKVGDLVKVANGHERFWTVVTEINGDIVVARVDSSLLGNILTGKKSPYNISDLIQFKRENIYEVWDLEEFRAMWNKTTIATTS